MSLVKKKKEKKEKKRKNASAHWHNVCVPELISLEYTARRYWIPFSFFLQR